LILTTSTEKTARYAILTLAMAFASPWRKFADHRNGYEIIADLKRCCQWFMAGGQCPNAWRKIDTNGKSQNLKIGKRY
jgi:hypothetical protein